MELLEWDAQSYDALPLPHKRWGPRTISRLRLAGHEAVADERGAVASRLAEPVVDYVRLQIRATRAGTRPATHRPAAAPQP